MLNQRLQACAAWITDGKTVCDVGTDHAYLAAELLRKERCQHVIASDIGEGPLQAARRTLEQAGLLQRATLLLSDGLEQVDGTDVSHVVIAGMGGETIRTVLLSGAEKLCGAVLVLSSHTEQPLVRRTLPEIGYHIVQEKLCQAAGRFYIFWRAEPGQAEGWTAEEVHYGRLLWVQNPPKMLLDYCRYRIKVMADRLTGLASAAGDVSRIRGEIAAEIDFYQRKITELEGALC